MRAVKSFEFWNNLAAIKRPELGGGIFTTLPLPKIVAYSVNNSGEDSPIHTEFVMYELEEPLFTKLKGSYFQQTAPSNPLVQYLKSKADLDKEKEKVDKELAEKERYISLGEFLKKTKIKNRTNIQLQNQQRRVGPVLFSMIRHFYDLSNQFITQGLFFFQFFS